jgi:putative nucleotidyltransferase with HDIG domain
MAAILLSPSLLDELFPASEIDPSFREKLLDYLQNDPEFPTYPTTLLKLQNEMNRPHTTLHQIAEIVKLDAGLTARLLALSNSASFGGSDITSVEVALFRLGFKETRVAILSTKLISTFSDFSKKISWETLWLHSLLVARLTNEIADCYYHASEMDYLAGLLHDTGKLLLGHFFPDQFQMILAECEKTGLPMHEVEKKHLGITHAALSTALCYRWNLDTQIIQGIRYHHTPEKVNLKNPLPYILNIADVLANKIEDNLTSSGSNSLLDYMSLPVWKSLHDVKPRRHVVLSLEKERLAARDLVSSLKK